MLVSPELEELAKKVRIALPGAVVPVEDIEASLLKTGSAFVMLSAGDDGVSSRLIDPYQWNE